MLSLAWIISSYLIGSFSPGFLISRWSRGVNILEVGRKQTGATNTFYWAGKWQGILTMVLDFSKGLVAVFGAKILGFAPEVQIISGLAAVVGHNWSLYLKFSGGRGVATTLGAVLALNPIIFIWAFIPFVALSLFWDAAVSTILFILIVFSVSIIFQEFLPVGFFAALVLPVILIKRLEGMKDRKFILNHILFDRSQSVKKFFRWQRGKKMV